VFASGSMMISYNTGWREEILDVKQAIIFIIIAHTEAATDTKVSWYSFLSCVIHYIKLWAHCW